MKDLILGAFLFADSVFTAYYAVHENAPAILLISVALFWVGTLITRRYFHG